MRVFIHRSSVFFTISPEFAHLKKYRWYLSRQGYARRAVKVDGRFTYRYAHSDIIGDREGYVVDHINQNRLDNRTSNLRHLTYSQNMANSKVCSRNSSGFRGVSFISGKWRAKIHIAGADYIIGRFNTKYDAAAEYHKVFIEWYGHTISASMASEMRGAA